MQPWVVPPAPGWQLLRSRSAMLRIRQNRRLASLRVASRRLSARLPPHQQQLAPPGAPGAPSLFSLSFLVKPLSYHRIFRSSPQPLPSPRQPHPRIPRFPRFPQFPHHRRHHDNNNHRPPGPLNAPLNHHTPLALRSRFGNDYRASVGFDARQVSSVRLRTAGR